MRRLLAALSLALTAGLLAGCGADGNAAITALGDQDSPDLPSATTKQLDDALQNALKQSGATGAIAGVWAPWSGSWKQADGTVSSAKGAAQMDIDDAFRIGSITKPMTCTVLLDLVADGRVKLDDEVSKYLPRMVGLNGLTLGSLCQNTSGVADYWGMLSPQIVTNPSRPWDSVELINSALGSARVGSPGEKWSYSNGGYVLLGLALQLATGDSWQQLYTKYITSPLGLEDTSLPTGTKLPSPSPRGYAPAQDVVTGAVQCQTMLDDTALSPSAMQTAGGLVSNLDDTASMIHAVAAGDYLPSTLTKQQQTGIIMSTGMPSWATYGIGVEKMGPLVGHASEVPGFTTAAYSDPGSGLTVVVMFNTSANGANFARVAALQLASIASKAAPSSGKKTPNIGLPWTADQMAQVLPYTRGCGRPAGNPSDAALAAIAAIQPSY
jgi:D-alanyl-D-alanine carboxypeptidase